MARKKTIQSVESEILKAQSELSNLQDKCDVLADHLSKLREEKRELEEKRIIDAYEKRGKSLEEMLTFLEV